MASKFQQSLDWLKEVHPENYERIVADNLRRGELLRQTRFKRSAKFLKMIEDRDD